MQVGKGSATQNPWAEQSGKRGFIYFWPSISNLLTKIVAWVLVDLAKFPRESISAGALNTQEHLYRLSRT